MATGPDSERVTRRRTPGPFDPPTRQASDLDMFPDEEAPTRPGGLQTRAAVLAAHWRLLDQDGQLALERLAAAWVSLAPADQVWLNNIVNVILNR